MKKENNIHSDILLSATAKSEVATIPNGYEVWRKEIISLIEQAKYKAALNVNAELLALYWKIGIDIIKKQKEQGWGTQIVEQLA